MNPWGRRRPLRSLAPDQLWLVIQTRQKTATFWEVTRSRISEVGQLPEHAWPVLSLDDEDLRRAVEKPCTNQQARSLIRRHSGQVARIINDSDQGMVYGRPVASVPTDDYALAPASMLIDQMLLARGWPAEPFVAGFLLSVPGSPNEILALWAGNVKKDLSTVQVTENAQQVERIIEAFCARHSIASDKEENLIVVDLEAVFAAIGRHGRQLRPYPTYDDVFGVPADTLWAGIAATAGLAALTALGAIATLGVNARSLDGEYQAALARTTAAQERVMQLFERDLATLTERASVDYRSLVARAAAVYAPGGRSAIYSEGASNRVRYTLQIEPQSGGAADASVIETTPYPLFKAARERTVDGSRPTVSLGGAGNELHYDYAFAAANRRLLDYIDR